MLHLHYIYNFDLTSKEHKSFNPTDTMFLKSNRTHNFGNDMNNSY